LDITHRAPFELGRTFGEVGSYSYLEGKAYFEINPSLDANTRITDIELGPVNSSGNIEFSADFSMLRPVDPEKGRRTIEKSAENSMFPDEFTGPNSMSVIRVFASSEGFISKYAFPSRYE
jgi:hypothetical protein